MSFKTTSFIFRILVIFMLLLSLFGTQTSLSIVSAGTSIWTSYGPEGGSVQTLAIDPMTPSTIYAGTELSGIFKSMNGGGSWSAVNVGLTNSQVNSIAIDPLTPTTLYAGTWGSGVFKSINAGGSWIASNNGMGNYPHVSSIVIDPVNPSTLFVGAAEGVFKSTNGGDDWITTTLGLTSARINVLLIDSLTPTTLYAGTDGEGVFTSTNGGDSWSECNSGLSNFDVRSLAIDPVTPATLYIGTNGGGISKSINGCTNWFAVNNGLSSTGFYALVIDPLTPTTLYAGAYLGTVYKSTNGANSWSTVKTAEWYVTVNALAIDPTVPTRIYASTNYDGVSRSTNAGSDWNTINNGLTATTVRAFAIDPVTPSTIYAGTYVGTVYKSTDGGGIWDAVENGLGVQYVTAMLVDPMTPTTLYAGTWGGMFKSTNSGGNWSPANTGLTNTYIRSLAIDPKAPSTLYLGTDLGGGVFKSMNGGGNWSAMNNGLTATTVSALAVNPVTPDILYAGTEDGGVFKSIDGGEYWYPINTGLTNTWVNALAIDPITPTTLYAGTFLGGVFRSTNGGGNWNSINSGLTNTIVSTLAINPLTPTTIYAGTDDGDGGVFKSTNSGESWSEWNIGLTHTHVRTLIVDPQTPTILYAGTEGGGVFTLNDSLSTCGTGTWTSGNLEIHHINIGQGDSTLIVGPTGKSLLFDAGESYWNGSTDAQTVGPYIESVLGCKELDYVVVSHFHVDHIGYVGYGGLYHLVENQGFTVGSTLVRDYNTYLGDISSTFTNWKTYLEGAGQAKLHPVTAIEGTSQVDLGIGVTFDIVAVDGNGAIISGNFSGDANPPSENDYSIGAVIGYGNFDEWIGGDLDGQYQVGGFGYTYHDIELSVAPEVGDVDVYKANHHASSHSSSATFINQLDPEVSIVTVGNGNTYGHPTQSIMDRLLATSTVYMTERGDTNTNVGSAIVAGTIVIKTSDGSTYTVNGTSYTATEPTRIDTDGDGYFVESDPNDNSSGSIPAPNGGCGPIYQTCSVACQVTSGQVLINEVLPAPSSGPEWVELYNTTNSTINLGYCSIDDIVAGSAAYQIPAGTLIPAYGFWTLDRTSYFNNTGDDVRFLKEDGSTVLDSYTFGNTGSDLSWYRFPDGGAWAISPTASTTKGLSNNTPSHPNVLASTRANPNPTSAAIVNFSITISKSVTGVNMSAPFSDFALTTTGVTGAAITNVSGFGDTYTVTVNTGSGNGTVRLDVADDDSIKDGSDNPLGGVGVGNGNYTTGQTYLIIKQPTFGDVTTSHPYWQYIEVLYANGLTNGCSASPLLYCPSMIMNRAQIAKFFMTVEFGGSYLPPANTPLVFQDNWSNNPWAQIWANDMKAKGLTNGCNASPLLYCPDVQIPREQVAKFSLAIKHGNTYTPPPASGTVFADMKDVNYWATAWAEQAYLEGLVPACGTDAVSGKPLFCPNGLVDRGFASFVIVTAKGLLGP